MLVMSNPYHCLDGKGRLAGACSEAEPMRADGQQLPLRRWVGARMEVTPGSYVPENHAAGLDAQADVSFVFDAEPTEVHSPDGQVTHFYLTCTKSGELLEVGADGKAPLDLLAIERAAAIESFKAHYAKEPDTKSWAKQFPLDEAVAKRAAKPAPAKPVATEATKGA